MHLVDLQSTTSEYISVLVEILGEGLAPKHGPAKPGEQLCRSMNPSLAAGVLGLRPEGDLAGGLKETPASSALSETQGENTSKKADMLE